MEAFIFLFCLCVYGVLLPCSAFLSRPVKLVGNFFVLSDIPHCDHLPFLVLAAETFVGAS